MAGHPIHSPIAGGSGSSFAGGNSGPFANHAYTESTFSDLSGVFNMDPGVSHNFVNNSLILSKSRAWTKVHDPATQAFLTRVPESTVLEVQHAVAVASSAQPSWASTSFQTRRLKLLDLVNVLHQNGPRIINCIIEEGGKTMQDAKTEFDKGIDAILTATAIGSEMMGTYSSNNPVRIHTFHEPVGVCVSITPYNFPFMIPLWSVPLAIMTGNTVVLKPSERTPTAAMILAESFLQADFPPGVFNVVHGGASAVNVLLSQPAVMAVSFVGSDIAGERVCEHARANRKRVQVETSGKNHGVIMEDSDKISTLYAIAGSAFGAAGQRCMALSLVVFVGSAQEWLQDLVEIAKSLVVGCGTNPEVGMGPLISASAKERVISIINSAEQEGARVVLDGRYCSVDGYPDGNFVGPTILTNVKTYMQCYQEEIFGPVLICLEVETLDEAIDVINENRYGNGCTLFTSNPKTAQTFQQEVNIGQIGINVPVLAPSGPLPRTSNKDSFIGDISGQGRSWQFFTMTKTVTTLWR